MLKTINTEKTTYRKNTEVDASVLSNGKVFKNYRDLCRQMNWRIHNIGDTSSEAQLKALSSVCKWRKDVDENGNKLSNKIIIEEVYSSQKSIKDKRTANAKNYLTRLVSRRILEIIAENEDQHSKSYHGVHNKLYMTLGSLYAQVGLVNSDYMDGFNRQDELSNELNCPVEHVNDFYNCAGTNMKHMIKTAFGRLKSQRLVLARTTKRLLLKDYSMTSDNGLPVCDDVVIGDLYASDLQNEFIFDCEREVMLKYGFRHFGQVYACNLQVRRSFFHEVTATVRKKAELEVEYELHLLKNLDYYYSVVEMSYSQHFVSEEVKRLGRMSESDRLLLKESLEQEVLEEYLSLGGVDAVADINQEHLNRITTNAKQRHHKARKSTTERDILFKRQGDSYPVNIERIAERVIKVK